MHSVNYQILNHKFAFLFSEINERSHYISFKIFNNAFLGSERAVSEYPPVQPGVKSPLLLSALMELNMYIKPLQGLRFRWILLPPVAPGVIHIMPPSWHIRFLVHPFILYSILSEFNHALHPYCGGARVCS
jgi:hypothetical protein